MTRTRRRDLLLVAVVVAAVTWTAVRFLTGRGGAPLPVPWSAAMSPAVIGAISVVLAWPVRRWTRGDRTRPLDPLRAARVLVLGRAASRAGAAVVGWYLGQLLFLLPDLELGSRSDLAVRAGVGIASSVLLVVAGLLVERFCRLPPDDDDPRRPRPPGPRGPRAAA